MYFMTPACNFHSGTNRSSQQTSTSATVVCHMVHSCALTNKRSAYGVRKKFGECLMTRRAFGEDVASTRYTTCAACHAKVCVDCWELISTKIEGIENGRRRVQPHDVWAAMKGRAYRQGCRERYSGFTPIEDGGGAVVGIARVRFASAWQCPLRSHPYRAR